MEYKVFKEQFKIGQTVIILRKVKFEDRRALVELDTVLNVLCRIPEGKHETVLEGVPKSYLHQLDVEGEMIVFIDQVAVCLIVQQIKNYEAYHVVHNWLFGKKMPYAVEIFSSLTEQLLGHFGQLGIMRTTLAEITQAQEDILHNYEEPELSEEEEISLSRDLKALRVKRREVKNELQRLDIINRFFNKHDLNGKSIMDLKNRINGHNNLENNRIYNIRGGKTEHEGFLVNDDDKIRLLALREVLEKQQVTAEELESLPTESELAVIEQSECDLDQSEMESVDNSLKYSIFDEFSSTDILESGAPGSSCEDCLLGDESQSTDKLKEYDSLNQEVLKED